MRQKWVNFVIYDVGHFLQYQCCGFTGPGDWLVENPEYCVDNLGLPESCHCDSDFYDDCFSVTIPIPFADDLTFSSWTKVGREIHNITHRCYGPELFAFLFYLGLSRFHYRHGIHSNHDCCYNSFCHGCLRGEDCVCAYLCKTIKFELSYGCIVYNITQNAELK